MTQLRFDAPEFVPAGGATGMQQASGLSISDIEARLVKGCLSASKDASEPPLRCSAEPLTPDAELEAEEEESTVQGALGAALAQFPLPREPSVQETAPLRKPHAHSEPPRQPCKGLRLPIILGGTGLFCPHCSVRDPCPFHGPTAGQIQVAQRSWAKDREFEGAASDTGCVPAVNVSGLQCAASKRSDTDLAHRIRTPSAPDDCRAWSQRAGQHSKGKLQGATRSTRRCTDL